MRKLILLLALLIPGIAAAQSNVTLKWTASVLPAGATPVTSYNVYRGVASGKETLLASAGLNLTYTDSTVLSGTTYYYEVTAVNSAGESPKSNEAIAVIPAAAVPPNPPTITITVTVAQ
jgi:fibronectin type 3 domain-containing protein